MISLLPYAIGALVLMYALWGLVLLLMQSRLLYQPLREVSLTPAKLDLDFEDALFESADGVRLTGWYVPTRDARYTLLFCHGNGGNIMHVLDSLQLFCGLGLSCFVFDYRGYGHSAGRPTEAGTYLDAQAAYDWLVREKHVPPERIILYGHSLGGSIAAHLAGRVRCGGLVVESAFTSYPDIGARLFPYMPVRPFARFRYDTREHLRQARCPVLVMHSRDDGLVPFEFGARLFEAAPEPKRFVEIRGGHNDGFLASGARYAEAWLQWLDFMEEHQSATTVQRVS